MSAESQSPRRSIREDYDRYVSGKLPHSVPTQFTPFANGRRLMIVRRYRTMIAVIACAVTMLVMNRAAWAQTLTNGPTSGQTTLLPAKDYASYAWQDAWDMDKRTDIGWMTWGVDLPTSQMTSKQLTGCSSGAVGCDTFKFLPNQTGQPMFFLLDPWQPGSSPLGKVGVRKPIHTDQFKYLIVKMRMDNSVSAASYGSIGSPPQMVVYWSRDTIYRTNPDGSTRTNGGILRSLTNNGTNPGIVLDADGIEANQWQLYVIDLSTLQWWNQTKNPGGIVSEPSSTAWGQSGITADSFFIQAINWPGSTTGNMEVDWVQLSETPGPAGLQSIKWSAGNATYDVVISPSSNCVGSNANAPDYSVVAENVTRTAGLSFPFGTLAAGTYYVGLRVAGNDGPGVTRGAIALCSAGSYVVPEQSALRFLTPTANGSADDYATVFLNDPWDFDKLQDVDFWSGLQNPTIDTAFPAQRPDGTTLGQIRVFRAGGLSNGDPYIYPLWFHGRGQFRRIDPQRYRIFSMDMGLDADRDLNGGSVARVYWHVSGDQNGGIFLENGSEDLALRHLPASATGGWFILDHVAGDLLNMGSIPIESDPAGPPSRSGWTSNCVPPYCPSPSSNPGIDSFRIDFNEFTNGPTVYIQQAKLAALERTGSTYQISWMSSTPNISGATAAVKLYADPANIQPASPRGTLRNPTDPTCSPSNNALKLLNGPQGTSQTLGANQSGQFSWNPQQTAGVSAYNGTDGSGEYYICGIIEIKVGGQTYSYATTLSEFPILVDPTYTVLPRLYFDKSALHFTAVYDRPTNSFTYWTPDQTVAITQVGSGAPSWQLALRQLDGVVPSYLRVSPSSGVGPGSVKVGLNPAGLVAPPLPDCTPPDGLVAVLTMSTGGTTSDDPQTVEVAVTIRPSANTTCSSMPTNPPQPPFGIFDTPSNGVTVTGAIAVTGWALDDLGVNRVEIFRNCAGPIDTNRGACSSVTPGGPADKVFIGNGNFVPGTRPDVQAAYPDFPFSDRAGWGYLLLSLGFPDLVNNKTSGGQGTFTLFAYAIDFEGNRVLLGQKSVTADNLHATKPFGTIDTPDQNATVPGTGAYSDPNAYPNFGWALTQAGKCLDPNDPNAYQVYVDGVRRTLVRNSNWFPGLNRSDISQSFPGLCNSNSALAAYYLNVGALGLSPGLHTIGWLVVDTGGNTDGIGSRFFTVAGGSGGSANLMSVNSADSEIGEPARIFDTIRPNSSGVRLSSPASKRPLILTSDANHLLRTTAVAGDLLQIDLPGDGVTTWSGYSVNRGRLWVMPPGATFDAAAGRLSWQPTAEFFGDYDFVFMRRGADGQYEKLSLRITIGS